MIYLGFRYRTELWVDDVAVVLKQDPEFMAGVKRGIRAVKENRMIPWDEVKARLEERER